MGEDLEHLPAERISRDIDEKRLRRIHRAGLIHGLVSGGFGLYIMLAVLLPMSQIRPLPNHWWLLFPALLFPLGATAIVGRSCAELLMREGAGNVVGTGLTAGAICSFAVPFLCFLGTLPFTLFDPNTKAGDIPGILITIPMRLGAVGLILSLPIGLATATLLREKVKGILADLEPS